MRADRPDALLPSGSTPGLDLLVDAMLLERKQDCGNLGPIAECSQESQLRPLKTKKNALGFFSVIWSAGGLEGKQRQRAAEVRREAAEGSPNLAFVQWGFI